ncbi:DUF218 domain-containing protein [Arcticibacter tournemirensis]|uniref:YdcF family protein n=1 Tax=Arcticibacter tournemirensis TaxID=699437 RepID=A0A5M9GNS7_9SPHI|nr:YdcF family protein [Arcticibacter tournemirensis]KAA8475409.1 YdcF family protein [Arcticibacter tournemirensis]TQM49907.1 DUF218 domain-containing protein [Arcticibacter tournemirensis]
MYRFIRKSFLASVAVGVVLLVPNQPARAQNEGVKTASAESRIAAKTFPLLDAIREDGKVKHIVSKDIGFQGAIAKRGGRLDSALNSCKDVACYAEAVQWTPSEMHDAASALIKLYQEEKALRELIAELKRKHAYPLYKELADTAFLRSAWNNSARGINYILDTYIKGKAPRYAKIDAIDFAQGDPEFKKQVFDSFTRLKDASKGGLFFDLPLKAALFALMTNGRDEAARYEPLRAGMNKAPFEKIKRVKWGAYKYSMILVPGLGPETPGVVLDPGGIKRCQEAVKRFRQGLAPFIVVSGGHVHPNKTPYCEAVEMKKYLTKELGIPDNVVFIEPHARHTTTNLRNLNRMVYRFGVPATKPVLIVTDTSQSSYIVNRMAKTALRDLGYLPYRDLKKLSPEDTQYYPVLNSLQPDPMDPMDP